MWLRFLRSTNSKSFENSRFTAYSRTLSTACSRSRASDVEVVKRRAQLQKSSAPGTGGSSAWLDRRRTHQDVQGGEPTSEHQGHLPEIRRARHSCRRHFRILAIYAS